MAHHGSESYYVVGEGLLTVSIGGREEEAVPATTARAAAAATSPFLFSRMGPKGTGVKSMNRGRSQRGKRFGR